MSNTQLTCLCGSVSITVTENNPHVGACHCSMCRKWGGGPLMTVKHDSPISFSGEENISVFSSSEWAERGFCKQCGTHLFYRLKETQEYYLTAGLFEDNKHFVFDHQVFIDNKPDYYEFANATRNMTEKEIFAMFANSDDN